MSATALVPIAMFLINETTRDIYVLPAEAASRIEGAKPCASIKLNVAVPVFYASSLDQMCASLAQGMLPKISSVVKTTWSTDHATRVGGIIKNLASLRGVRREPQVWPPEVPFTVSGLSQLQGVSVVFGVRVSEKQAALLERVDAWAQVDGRFLRSYWSRSIQDPTNSSTVVKILQRIGSSFQRSWRAPSAPPPNQEALRILVDKKISERELASLETVVKAMSKGVADTHLVPVNVDKNGIRYQTNIPRGKIQEVVARFSKEIPALKAQIMNDGPVDISLTVAAPR